MCLSSLAWPEACNHINTITMEPTNPGRFIGTAEHFPPERAILQFESWGGTKKIAIALSHPATLSILFIMQNTGLVLSQQFCGWNNSWQWSTTFLCCPPHRGSTYGMAVEMEGQKVTLHRWKLLCQRYCSGGSQLQSGSSSHHTPMHKKTKTAEFNQTGSQGKSGWDCSTREIKRDTKHRIAWAIRGQAQKAGYLLWNK